MQTIAEVLKKIEDYSISNRAEFETCEELQAEIEDRKKKLWQLENCGIA